MVISRMYRPAKACGINGLHVSDVKVIKKSGS
jgi:hypothetical protein